MLRKIKLYGKLAKFVGHRILKADVATAAEAVRFLVANWPQLEGHMADQYYRVSVGTYDLALNEIHDPAGQQEIRIIPVMAGAGAVGRILIGVALIAASFIPGVGAFAVALLFSVGASLVLGGIGQLLTPTPKLSDEQSDPRKSFSFSGIQNTSRQGIPVPIVYGETLVGSVVISAGIDTVQVIDNIGIGVDPCLGSRDRVPVPPGPTFNLTTDPFGPYLGSTVTATSPCSPAATVSIYWYRLSDPTVVVDAGSTHVLSLSDVSGIRAVIACSDGSVHTSNWLYAGTPTLPTTSNYRLYYTQSVVGCVNNQCTFEELILLINMTTTYCFTNDSGSICGDGRRIGFENFVGTTVTPEFAERVYSIPASDVSTSYESVSSITMLNGVLVPRPPSCCVIAAGKCEVLRNVSDVIWEFMRRRSYDVPYLSNEVYASVVNYYSPCDSNYVTRIIAEPA